ncbi:hypothetical protein G6R29_03480 [Fructobacillus sp. M2-14]|uniref:Cyclic lactone autoinducer peptide n=1 Tax=Fructobacillus broussonetiae TaxID=2713173 RepID=A0ABS5R0F4_9LACO|nr:hypothetical protein [Fructobacillus broussonetiae]MBS9338692.1 hypothetical protein [Fructobacillus broussonetiae]
MKKKEQPEKLSWKERLRLFSALLFLLSTVIAAAYLSKRDCCHVKENPTIKLKPKMEKKTTEVTIEEEIPDQQKEKPL